MSSAKTTMFYYKTLLIYALLLTCSSTTRGSLDNFNPVQEPVILTSNIEIERLVDLAASLNNVEIEYATGAMRNMSVTFRLTHELTPTELWGLCLKTLHKEGHTIIRLDGERGLYSVVPITTAAVEVLPSNELERSGLMPGYQSIILPLKRVAPDDMATQINAFLQPNKDKIVIEAIDGTKNINVRGLIERVVVIADLVQQFDQNASESGMIIVEVENRPAIEIVADVNAVISALQLHNNELLDSTLIASTKGHSIRVYGPVAEQDRVRSLIKDSDQIEAVETRVFDPRGYPLETVTEFIETMAKDSSTRGSGELWRVSQDRLTNTLIVTGTPNELRAVEDSLQMLADIPPESKQVIRMIEVHNREASKVREIVGQLLAARLLGGGNGSDSVPLGEEVSSRLGSSERAPNPRAWATDEQFRSDLELAVDDEMNVIIATGSPRRIQQVEQLVSELDVRQPQVQLEVILLSLSESETHDLGVELAGVIDTGDTLIGLGSLFGLSSISPSSTSALASGNGGSAIILSPGDFSAVIRAVETVNDGRSLSMPSIVVNNNETATLSSTTTQPYLSTTITDSVTQNARGGATSAGTTINVSPQIAAGDHIVLDYSFTLSSFVGEASTPEVEPPTQQTSLNSIATIPDGYTIALGGIDSSSIGDSVTKTPGLSALPIIGNLFKSESDSTSRSRFYVFIRATVMRSPSFEYLKYISEDLADELGVDDGWPKVEPRIIR